LSIRDEYGTGWVVRGGDPGARLINQLKRETEGLDFVVLPRVSLITGSVVAPDLTPEDIITATRLQDCLDLLREGS